MILVPMCHFLPTRDEQGEDDLPYVLEAKVDRVSPSRVKLWRKLD